MQKAKSLAATASITFLLLAVLTGYFSIKNLSALIPAESYEDKGIYTFEPYEVLPEQVKNTSAYSRDRRLHPTKTVYMVCYRDNSGQGYRWKERAASRSLGEKVVAAGNPVKRRVLSIPESGAYITVEEEQTAESYTAGLRQKYILLIGLSGAYIVMDLTIYGVLWVRKKRQGLWS